MIQRSLKLKLTVDQERRCETLLFRVTGIYNWTIRKIEQDAAGGKYWTYYGLTYEISGHSAKCDVPSMIIQGTIKRAHQSWARCFRKLGNKPRLKSARNRLTGIDISGGVVRSGNRIHIPGIGRVRFHKDNLPDGKLRGCRLIRKSGEWYLNVSLDIAPTVVVRVSSNRIGIDPGFSSLLSFSDGTKVDHPRELEASAAALARSQRGGHKRLTARIQQRIANQRRDRNHKLSRKLVSENALIVFSEDNHKAIARSFGKSVASSGHAQLRQMLAYKSRLGGTQYIEVASRYSTRTCSACGSLSGPTGYAGLDVKRWVCQDCGVEHDRDCNAAVNTLRWGEVHPRISEIASNERCAMTGSCSWYVAS